MKGKTTLTIVLGIICFLLVVVMSAQFKTVEKTDIKSIETMREAELRATLLNWKNKYEETEKQLQDVNQKISEYKENGVNTEEAIKILEQELKEANLLLGKTNVVGKGVIVTLSDNDKTEIDQNDILQLFNELKLAGAEAISINNIRVINSTDVAEINGTYIKIDDNRINSPYIVKAIGDPVKLESGLMQKTSGYIDRIINAMNKTAIVEREDTILIPQYEGKISTKYIETEEQK